MTRKEVPAQAVNIKKAIASNTTCTSSTVSQLRSYLFPEPLAKTVANFTSIAVSRVPKSRGAQPKRDCRARSRKQPQVPIHEPPEVESIIVSDLDQAKLATDIINMVLRGLTDSVKVRSPAQEPCKEKRSTHTTNPNPTIVSPNGQRCAETPLRTLSINIVCAENGQCKEKRQPSRQSTCSDGAKAASGFAAQAECARLAFSALKTLDARGTLGKQLPFLQLENAMSTMVNKLVALGLFDPASRQLHALKQSLLDTVKGAEKAGSPPYEDTSNRERMTDLLVFPCADIKGPLLAMIATFQLQVLRLIAARPDSSLFEATYKHLQPSNPYSPVKLIQAQHDPADPGTSAKVANQLEALSRLVLSMSPATSSSEDHKSVHSKAIDPLTAFRLQNLGLELRSSWWSIAGHEGDIAKDILVPFSQHLSAFRRRCVTGYEEGYRSAKSALASLTLPGQCENQSTSATAVWSEAWLSISSEMVQLSRTICLPNEVRDWLAGCTKILVHKRMSACKRCALTCRKAVLYAQASTSLPNDGELVDALRDAEQHVEGSLDGSSEELDELLLVLSRLRNAAGIIVNKSRTPLQKLETPPAPDLIKQCYSICSTCVKFLNRYIGSRPSQNANHQLNRRYQQRLKQALAVATAFVDSVISIAQHIKGVDPDEWTRIDNGLQACIRLATLIQASHQEIAEDAANRNSSSNISISVSNTYWLRYSHLKQADGDRKEALKALKASVGAVEHRPLACKLAAHLQTRLEHYGNALEGAREFGKAVDIYQKSVRLYMETGVLQKAAETAATQSVSIAFARQGDTASLGRVLSACARVAIRTEEGISATYMISQDEPLEPMQRGMALEHQLATLVPMLEKGSIELLVKAINCLAKELLAIYSEDTFPIRRFRVIETLLWLQASRSDILSPELLDPVFMYSVNAIDGKTQRADLGLQLLVPHLNASRNSVLAIREECPTRKQQMLKTAICSWYLLVEQSHDLEALETRVGDPSFWLLHLELLAQYLEAYGLGLQRRSALQLLITLRERFFPTQHKELIFDLTQSGLQFLRLGYPHQAGLAFHRAQRYINKAEGIGEAAVRFFVGYAEYFLAVGSVSKCEENLAQARMIVMSSGGKQCLDMYSYNRTELPQLLAGVASLASDLAGKRGHPFTALLLARQSLNFVLKAWTDVERRQKRFQRDKGNIGGEVDVVGLVDSMSKMALPDHSTINNRPIVERKGSVHWRLVPQLHKAFLQVSRLCEKEGMFTEAQYFAARSEKLAETSSAYSLAVRSVSYLADLLARSGDYVEADSRFALASKQFLLLEEDQHFLEFQMDLMNHQLARGQTSAAEKTCLAVESTIRRLINPNLTQRTPHEQPDIIALQGQLSQMTVGTDESCPPGLEKRAPTRNTLKKSLPTARSARRDTASSLDEEVSSLALLHMRCRFSRQRIVLTIRQSKLDQARDFVVEATKKYFASEDSVLHAMLNAEIYVSRGLEALNSDPVYCVLQESTISLPSVTARKLSEPEAPLKASLAKAGRKPAKRGTVAADGKRVHADSQASTDYLGHELLQAHIETSKVYQLARTACSTATIHHLSKIMSENLLKLSALSIPIPQICFQARPCTLLGITDVARSVCVSRGQLAVKVEKTLLTRNNQPAWPHADAEECRDLHMADQTLDSAIFHEQYLDLLPHTWQVLTVSLSRSKEEVLVSRMRSGQGPFILSLPLDRHSSRDPDEESFGYYQAKTELRDIVTLANHSTHSMQATSGKGARLSWWEGRAALDARLRDLLANIQNMWFGGFQGVFAQQLPPCELLSRFQESLNVVLDNHLPSRRGLGKSRRSQQVSLDPRVTELFVALGDPALLSDMEEPLMDLLYFVIDILQFNGERNAYDEIDFDSMTIEIFDALRQYHEAVKRADDRPAIRHTVLILDKELHCFPWESLPCLEGQAVTRLPALSCLRDRLLSPQQKGNIVGSGGDEHIFCVDRGNGAYILNPAGDLRATQGKFEQQLRDLSGWVGAIESEPCEDQLKGYLQERDIFLYFGHGSGSQYIRSRTVQKLDKCAVALLMGCSSGKLTEAGEFEPYGTPMSYMQAGCPAMVATLWDVTDKDIDRFSETMLQKWGLFGSQPSSNASPVKKSTRAKGKGKVRQSPPPEEGHCSLDQAVAQGRASCIFRYLNGAAPVVYGIPIFLS